MPISEKVKALQEQKGWTTAELAEEANLPIDTINKIRSGTTRNPSPDTLQRLASAFDVTLDELVNGTAAGETLKAVSGAKVYEIALRAQAETYEARLAALDKDRTRWRQVALIMLGVCITVLFAIVVFLGFIYWDLSHPASGNIIYDASKGLFG